MKGLLCCFAFFIWSQALCQDRSNGFYGGVQYGIFAMTALMDYQDEIENEIRLPLNNLESFPNHGGLEFGYIRSFNNKYQLEVFYNYISTGSRLYYEDYSGKCYFDQVLGGNSLGVHNKFKEGHSKFFDFYIGFRVGMTFSKLSNEFYLSAPGAIPTQKEQYNFKSINGFVAPSFSVNKDFKAFFIKAEIRYEAHFQGKLKSTENSDYYLVDISGEPVKVGWDGLRGFIGAGIKF